MEYYGMKRCRFCESWGVRDNWNSNRFRRDMHYCNAEACSTISTLANERCDKFTSGGVLPELAVEEGL